MESSTELVQVKEERSEDSPSAVFHNCESEKVTTTPITVKMDLPEISSYLGIGTETTSSVVYLAVKEEPTIDSTSLAFHLQEEREVEIRLSADELAKYRSSLLCPAEEQPSLDGLSVSCDSLEAGSSVKLECLPSDELSDYEMDSCHMNDPLLTVGSYIQLYCKSKGTEKVKHNTFNIDSTLPTEKEPSLSEDDKCKMKYCHKCPFCTKRYPRKSRLLRHMDCVHPDLSGPKCEICLKRFPNGDFQHHTDKYKCDICKKGCSSKKKLAQHIGLHTKKKIQVYKCKLCTKQFTRKENLETHFTLSHRDEKSQECEICKKRFGTASHLNRHRMTHTRDYPFKCDFCLKGFTDKYLVTRHKRIHTGERPYKCEHCPKQFKVKSVLVRHSSIHTRFHECPICKKTYSKGFYFNKHVQKCNLGSDRDWLRNLKKEKNKNDIK